MRRRRFLQFAGVAGSSWLLSRCAAQPGASSIGQRWSSQDGLLALDLTAQHQTVNLGSQRAQLITYNGQVPGPWLEARPGDTLQLRLINQLAQPTNLHYHGLHIPPTGTADNPFLPVPPGETLTYEFQIPPNHPTGLFWYHPHVHGRVAEQIFAGLAGPLVIRGGFDEIPAIQAATEVLMVLKDFDLDRQGRVRTPNPMFQRWGREGGLLTVNGQVRPNYGLGALGRLRLLNASASKVYRLALQAHPLYLVATDGISLAAPVEVPELVLSPGERAEVLVQIRQPGVYPLLSLPYDRGMMQMMGGMPGMGGGMGAQTQPVVLATLTVSESEPLPLPEQLLPLTALPAPSRTREFILDHGIDHHSGAPFLINGRAFDPNRVDTRVKLGTVEDWVIVNQAGMDHPFHLHTNAFQVMQRDGQPAPYRAWKDTVTIKSYETVRIRVRFADYPGKTVYHCHIADHEDQGMMGVIEMQT
jgi:FtsP/CotA-like multicopper oxidase with cupredoxin domain